MKNKKLNLSIFIVSIFLLLGLFQTAGAQFGIKVPKLPKPTPTPAVDGKTDTTVISGNNTKGQTKSAAIPGHYNFSATAPAFDASSLLFHLWTLVSEYSRGTEGQPQVWAPTPTFTIYGPVEEGTLVNVAFTLPNGSAWFNSDCTSLSKVGPGRPVDIECPREKIPKDKPTTQTGLFGFKVTLKNELSGTSAELFAGKFKVESFVDNPTNNPKFAKNFVYYPNLDWKLSTAFVYSPPPKDQYDTNGPLKLLLWFRGKKETTFENNIIGHLFYQGKEVAATNAYGANNVTDTFTEVGWAASENEYQGRILTFNAYVYDKENGSTWFPIYKNPGEYEIKILQNGRLARSVKFTVDAGGNIVNNGANARLGTTKVVVPVQVIGEQDGKWNKTAWSTEGFLGNPLPGFSAP
ncbi:MAG: hypothetical protein JSS81_22110 [Acidobacteria bacterium]|nr:hypothetical protein [Acidobacteriota bacterium]